MTVSRRSTLNWIAAAGAFAAAPGEAFAQQSGAADWGAEPAPLRAQGYGSDPNLKSPAAPWPLTLSDDQHAILRASAELMLPADARSPSGGALPLEAFIDEWISAPYPQQQRDRALILPGLQWLDDESRRRSGTGFTASTDAERRALFDAIAFRQNVQPGYERSARFFARLRSLMLAGYYSLPEGMADIGYIGNTPTLGDYPGPTPEALAHLDAALSKMNLKRLHKS